MHHSNFAGLPQVLAAEGLAAADLIVADLGVSSMQLDNPDRGFSYKGVGPLDMRMNPSRGESASQLLARVSEATLARLLQEHSDEPHADLIAGLLKQQPLDTTNALERLVRTGLTEARAVAREARREDVSPAHATGASDCRERRVLGRWTRCCGRCRTASRPAVAWCS